MQENTTKELKTPMTTKQKVWFGVKIALNVVFYIVNFIVLLFSISNIRAKNKNDQIPNIFGKGYLNVLSDSMTGDNEDSFNTGDMIIVKIANKKNISKLEVGNIVTFYDYRLASNKGAGSALDTHRIVYIDKTNNDSYVYYTVGDKIAKQLNFDASKLNADNYLTILNSLGSNNYQAFGSTEIRGIYSGKWSGFGKTIQTINNHFIAIIIVPVAILLVFEIGVLVLNIMRAREEKLKLEMKETSQELANQETISADEKEKLKAELRAELLKEMLKESDNEEESKEKEENK